MARQGSPENPTGRDSLVVITGLVLISALAWVYTIHHAAALDGMAMPQVRPWEAADFLMMFLMWAVMMVAMMLPSAAPMILAYSGLRRRMPGTDNPGVVTSVFALSYLVVWAGFSLAATIVNWGLHQAGLMTSMMGSAVTGLGGILLIVAGAYQWSRLKNVCLTKCRSPVAFLLTSWRSGVRGAWWMGLEHGTYCVLCCWALMTLLFVLGVMNLIWIAILAAIALAEKVSPAGTYLARALGLGLMGWGTWLLVGAP